MSDLTKTRLIFGRAAREYKRIESEMNAEIEAVRNRFHAEYFRLQKAKDDAHNEHAKVCRALGLCWDCEKPSNVGDHGHAYLAGIAEKP